MTVASQFSNAGDRVCRHLARDSADGDQSGLLGSNCSSPLCHTRDLRELQAVGTNHLYPLFTRHHLVCDGLLFSSLYQLSAPAGGANVSFSSINHARIYGFELQYEQQFRFLPCPLDGLGVRGSFSRIFSQGQTHPGREETSLPSQAGVIWNGGIFYQKYNWTIWVGATFTGHNLLAVGAPPRTLNGTTVPPSADTYFDGYLQVDAKVQYAINKNLTVYFEGNNLNDGPLRFYAGDPSHPLQNEYYGPSFAGGVKLTF